MQSQSNGVDVLAGLFSPPIYNGLSSTLPSSGYGFSNNANAATNNQGNTDSANGRSRVFQFNSQSTTSNSASPRSSSASHYGGPSSSCGTSPEPHHNSPPHNNLDTVNENGYVCRANSEGEVSFCEKLNMACGNPRNPVPRAMSRSNGTFTAPPAAAAVNNAANNSNINSATTSTNAAADINGIDWLANQNGGQFDPLLFGNYRESQAAVVGDGDFTGGFFNEAFPYTDFGSPFNFGDITASPAPATAAKPNPLEVIERQQDGNADDGEEVVPAADKSQLLSCHKIWYVPHQVDVCDGTELTRWKQG